MGLDNPDGSDFDWNHWQDLFDVTLRHGWEDAENLADMLEWRVSDLNRIPDRWKHDQKVLEFMEFMRRSQGCPPRCPPLASEE